MIFNTWTMISIVIYKLYVTNCYVMLQIIIIISFSYHSVMHIKKVQI